MGQITLVIGPPCGRRFVNTKWEYGMRKIIAFLKDDSGTETLEWGLVCGLIVVGALAAIGFIGPKVTDMWNDLNNKIPNATD